MNILDKLNPVLRDVHRNFDFLLSKGYKIRTTDLKSHGMLFWSIVFESPKCLIHIYEATGEIFLAFAPLNAVDLYDKNRSGDLIDIHTMIFYLTKGKRFIGKSDSEFYRSRGRQLQALADLLKEYIDQIEPYFGSYEFQMHKDEMLSAQHEYNNLLIIKHVPKTSYRML